MNIFSLHKNIISDYKSYINSFLKIKDERIQAKVEAEMEKGVLCPEPLVQFNPSFKIDKSVETLCKEGALHPTISKIFKGFDLYQHQVEALELGASEKDFIVTSGTGSGKSLTYIGTIFNSILNEGIENSGIKAIIVYPMNALINSQTAELEKFKENYGDGFPIKFQQYTGQEGQEIREGIKTDPPHILLTNYMMLELIMTRATEHDRAIRDSIKNNLKFLVFDELHTYRGRQGSDIAMLIRRIKSFVNNSLQCIGTSATLSSGVGDLDDQKDEVAQVGERLFGSAYSKDQIVSETLSRVTDWSGVLLSDGDLAASMKTAIDTKASEKALQSHPLAIWLENRIGLEEDNGWLKRRDPITFPEIVENLANDSGLERAICEQRILELLNWSEEINQKIMKEGKRSSYFPFRLHQFISQSGNVYTTLESREKRNIQLEPGYYIPDSDYEKKRIYPVVFSRITGHEFICVRKNYSTNTLEPRSFRDSMDADDSTESGYIIIEYPDEDPLWDESMIEDLPEAWYRRLKSGELRIDRKYANRIPTRIHFNALGSFSESQALIDSDESIRAWFMPVKLLFDPTCWAFYDLKSSEYAKLMQLGNEGRSTATTTISLATIKNLEDQGVPSHEQKLLSFTDNRQDAALQSGHFNDFVNIGLIRSAIHHALKEVPEEGVGLDQIVDSVFRMLDLDQEEYATVPARFAGAKQDNEDILKDYLLLRILQDLKRSWRFTLPNLEQCALLNVEYKYIKQESENEEAWADIPYLNTMNPNIRLDFVNLTLDYFRTSDAINHRFFFEHRRSVESKIKEKLLEEWGFGFGEKIPNPNHLRYESVGKIRQRGIFTKSIGSGSSWGKYARKLFSEQGRPSTQEFVEFCQLYFKRLEEMGLLKSQEISGEQGNTTGYILNSDVIIWKAGDRNTVKHDKVRVRTREEVVLEPNYYFQNYYSQSPHLFKSIKAKEHTGQIQNADRQEREKAFRKGELSALFCSPTMELGIDIANLNIVHMRNVPPNPANYAQRSGRAGRSGQGALVITYCSQYSSHDRNYFEKKLEMINGVVKPPRISIENLDLIISHIQALYFLETGIHLSNSIADIIDESNLEKLSIKTPVLTGLNEGHPARKAIVLNYMSKILEADQSLSSIIDLEQVEVIIEGIPKRFDHAFDRWRQLYRNALKLRDASRAIIDNPIYAANSDEKQQAERNERFAKKQILELRNDNTSGSRSFSEFYPFRYLASEGFLPGYNFTKLPIRVAINGYKTAEYLSRPRLIAIREFGPRNIIYHNGQSYEIKRISVNDIESNLIKAKIAKNSGYFLYGDEYARETCPITGVNLAGQEDYILSNLLEMSESVAEIRQRINSEEEERQRLGYDTQTYFSLPNGLESSDNIIVKTDKQDLLNIFFMPTAKIIEVNKKWKRTSRDSFLVDKFFGYWKKEADLENDEENRIVNASLFTDYIADALYIQPVKQLSLNEDQVITLQYALKRAIEEEFQMESNEISVTLMGEGTVSNIFIYESAEGSLGILSQFAKEQTVFRRVLTRAYELCHFKDGEDLRPEAGPASYNDLLSYYNQRHHEQINRHDIKDILESLMDCTVELQPKSSGDYESHFQDLMSMYDKNSSTERKFLEHLHENGLRLPDKAQPKLKQDFGLYVMPDFQYDKSVFVFCDGTPHDDPDTKERDRKQRKAMRKKGLRVITYYYMDDLYTVTDDNRDIFYKVK